MILLVHQHNKVISVSRNEKPIISMDNKELCVVFFEIAREFPEDILVWCNLEVKESVNFEAILELMDLNRKFISYHPNLNYFSKQIGYVEESPFININKSVTYTTWQMNSLVGAVHTATILKFDTILSKNSDFDFLLNSLAKVYMPRGMFCYSEPKLLKENCKVIIDNSSNLYSLFSFVRQQYKLTWLFLLALNILLFERKIVLLPFLKSLFFHKRITCNSTVSFETLNNDVSFIDESVDVIIPTIGRSQYLHDVLLDLKEQTLLPKNIIIVEQNPQKDSVSELNYLTEEKWPFAIKHFFIHQPGACNARNLALHHVESKWIFFADDDIRLKNSFLYDGFKKIINNKLKAVVFKCIEDTKLQINDEAIIQTTIFGSGSSIIASNAKVLYNKKLEFGYGEDSEFGLHLRNLGTDVVYVSNPNIFHLKAPIGGFRYKHDFPWDKDKIKPLPVPTILLYKKLYYSNEQINGFKTSFFLHLAQKQNGVGIFFFYRKFMKQWDASNFWSNKLRNENQ